VPIHARGGDPDRSRPAHIEIRHTLQAHVVFSEAWRCRAPIVGETPADLQYPFLNSFTGALELHVYRCPLSAVPFSSRDFPHLKSAVNSASGACIDASTRPAGRASRRTVPMKRRLL